MSDTLNRIFLDAAVSGRVLFMRKNASGWANVEASQALADVESLALALAERGVKRGDHVGLISETRYEWAVADLAILGLGAVTVPIYPSLTSEQVGAALGNAGCRVVVASNAMQVEKLRAAHASLPALEEIVVMDDAGVEPGATPPAHPWHELVAQGAALRASHPDAFRTLALEIRPDDVATIIYTSGTTGEPKGAMLTHGNIASNVHACLEVVALRRDEVALSFLPLCHIFERMAGLYTMLYAGVVIAYAEGFEHVATNAREVRPMIINGVPRFYEKVRERVYENVRREPPLRQKIFAWGMGRLIAAEHARRAGRAPAGWDALMTKLADRLVAHKIRDRVGGRLRLCISGGAPLSRETFEFFFAIGIRILEGYGLTETSPVICLNRPGHEKAGAVGPPVPGVEVRIGEDGEILTRGPHVMLGYYRNPEATQAAIRDGWYHTGDIGTFDDEGRLMITDRRKELLVAAGGKKGAPQPLEARFKQSPWIAEAVLIGDRRPYVVALVVLDFGAVEAEARKRGWPVPDRAALLEHEGVQALVQAEVDQVNRDLASFEQIKRFALLPRELSQDAGEITPTLKVKRRVILERYGDLIEGLYQAPRQRASA